MTILAIAVILVGVYFVIRTIMELLPMVLLGLAIFFGVTILAKAYFTKTTGKMYDVPEKEEA